MKLEQTMIEDAGISWGEFRYAASPALRYYIHDHSHAFRLQLVGSFGKGDIPELDGCWNTARRSVAERKVCIDLRGVSAIDADGREWLAKMSRAERVEFVVSQDVAHDLPAGSSLSIEETRSEVSRGWKSLLRFFMRERRPALYKMTAADPSSQPG